MLDNVTGGAEVTGQAISEMNLLVVDDDEFILKLTRRILARIGCENVTAVSNGKLAIDELNAGRTTFDIILTDLNMPEMDGVELLRHIAECDYTGGIILLSGEDERILDTAYDLARSHKLNVLGTIPKPLQPDALKELLVSHKSVRKFQSYGPQEPVTVDELKAGIRDEELLLFYQPKVSVDDGKITGAEALARWRHKERGILGPGAFIPVAEKHGLIDDLTRAICRKAVRQIGSWQAEGVNLNVSINVSINSFAKIDFSDFLIAEAQNGKLDPSCLTLEVTESHVMLDAKGCLEKMVQLRMKRFGLSIDDFGTGNSTMEQLRRIPFNELKIDRSFVTGAARNSSALAILESSINLGKKMNMCTVAEGVETREDWDLVERLNCDFVQGFYVAKPMPGDQVLPFIKGWSGPS